MWPKYSKSVSWSLYVFRPHLPILMLTAPRSLYSTCRMPPKSAWPAWSCTNYSRPNSSAASPCSCFSTKCTAPLLLMLLLQLYCSLLLGVALFHSDLPGRMMRSQVTELLRLQDIAAREPNRVTVEECSAFTGTGLDSVLQWLVARKKEGKRT